MLGFHTTKYYLVSYAHFKGFGNIFFQAKPHLDVRAAEKEIMKNSGNSGVVILSFTRISKSQFVAVKEIEEVKK